MRNALLSVLSILLLAGCTTTVVRGSATYDAPGPSSPAGLDVVDPATPVAEHAVQEIAWHDCTDLIGTVLAGHTGRYLEFDCGVLQVPVDYYDAATARMPIAMVRVHLAGTTGQQPLLVNPGGPGAGGIDLAVGLATSVAEPVLAAYDLVGFDPRGTGQSQPIRCLDDAEQDVRVLTDPAPHSPEDRQQLKAGFDDFATQCASAYPALAHLNTMATARDMEQIRSSLGVEKLNYLGYSYGSKLGAAYLTLFGEHAGAFVLDGAVDLAASRIERFEAQVAGFEGTFERFAADCVATGCPAGSDPRQVVIDLVESTRAAPLVNPIDARPAGPAVVLTATAAAMYAPTLWPDLAEALATAAGTGDPTGLFTLADAYWGRYRAQDGTVHWSGLLDANAAVNCADTIESIGFAEATQYAATWAASYPVFGADAAYGLYQCTPWQPTRYPLPDVSASAVDGAVLVIGTTNDPATPYSGAISLTADLGEAAVLLTLDGDGHTAYPGNACIDQAVDAYLLSGTAPPAGTVCSE